MLQPLGTTYHIESLMIHESNDRQPKDPTGPTESMASPATPSIFQSDTLPAAPQLYLGGGGCAGKIVEPIFRLWNPFSGRPSDSYRQKVIGI